MPRTTHSLTRPIALVIVAVLAAGCTGRSIRDTVGDPDENATTVVESPVPGEADLPNATEEDGVPDEGDDLGTEDGEE